MGLTEKVPNLDVGLTEKVPNLDVGLTEKVPKTTPMVIENARLSCTAQTVFVRTEGPCLRLQVQSFGCSSCSRLLTAELQMPLELLHAHALRQRIRWILLAVDLLDLELTVLDLLLDP